MESVATTIKKIKLQEQVKEAKLREQREFDTTVMTLNRAIRDALSRIDKSHEECETLKIAVNKLQSQMIIENVRRKALEQLVANCHEKLQALRKKSDEGVSNVWVLRSTLLEAVRSVSEKCDVWPMLVKPASEVVHSAQVMDDSEPTPCNDKRLKKSIERRDKAIAERNRLLCEPEVGEEYIRIKNAIQYSMEMAAINSSYN